MTPATLEPATIEDATRREFITGVGATLAAALLAACGDDDEPSSASTPTSGFPVTVDHRYGSTRIPAAPERVVSVGFTDQDYLFALGAVPVGIREWFGKKPSATWPWAQSYLNGAQPAVLPRLELDLEQIAALKPDLIIGVYSGMTEQEYQTLSKIAPTVAQPAGPGDYAVTWQEQTRITGRALGRSEKAEELIAVVEGRIGQARADHPEFAGATVVFASATGGEYYVYGPGNTAALFLTSLGLQMPDEVVRLTDNPDVYFAFSGERLDLVDADLTLWSEAATDEGPAALLASPIYQQLPVHTEGRDLFLGLDLYNGALSFSSVLSLSLLLDELVPAMSAAIDGDPETKAKLGGN